MSCLQSSNRKAKIVQAPQETMKRAKKTKQIDLALGVGQGHCTTESNTIGPVDVSDPIAIENLSRAEGVELASGRRCLYITWGPRYKLKTGAKHALHNHIIRLSFKGILGIRCVNRRGFVLAFDNTRHRDSALVKFGKGNAEIADFDIPIEASNFEDSKFYHSLS